MAPRESLSLVEWEPQTRPKSAMTFKQGEALWQRYSKQINVEFPSPKTGGEWKLTPGGWVGYIPLDSDLGLELRPKVPLVNLFHMLEYAYRIKKDSLKFPKDKGLIESESLQDYFESLAHILAKRVLGRVRQGLYQAYLGETRDLQYVRGRIDIRHHAQTPWSIDLRCHYDDRTADVVENQILAWTLFVIARAPLRDPEIAADVRRAYRAVVGAASLEVQDAGVCVGRAYNRLNEDYEPLHALCRFFLEHTGPSRNLGDRTMLPFLVDMADVFEMFVSEWLQEYLPEQYEVRAHLKERVGGRIRFDLDLVLFDKDSNRPICVLDTKYKDHYEPTSADLSQVVTYAVLQDCERAALVYPRKLSNAFHAPIGEIDVQAFSFPVGEDIQAAGEEFRDELLSWVCST